MGMKVLVFGGRHFRDTQWLYKKLNRIHATTPVTLVVQGGASGADRIGKEWAEENEVDCVTVPAKWKTHGSSAGPMRNIRMVNVYCPDLGVGAPGGKGTADMKKKLRAKGVEIV